MHLTLYIILYSSPSTPIRLIVIHISCVYTGLIVNGLIAFVLPLILVLKALDKVTLLAYEKDQNYDLSCESGHNYDLEQREEGEEEKGYNSDQIEEKGHNYDPKNPLLYKIKGSNILYDIHTISHIESEIWEKINLCGDSPLSIPVPVPGKRLIDCNNMNSSNSINSNIGHIHYNTNGSIHYIHTIDTPTTPTKQTNTTTNILPVDENSALLGMNRSQISEKSNGLGTLRSLPLPSSSSSTLQHPLNKKISMYNRLCNLHYDYRLKYLYPRTTVLPLPYNEYINIKYKKYIVIIILFIYLIIIFSNIFVVSLYMCVYNIYVYCVICI